MRAKIGTLCLVLLVGAGLASAQARQATVSYADVYCSGMYSKEGMPRDTYVISGEESGIRIAFEQGQWVYINRGSSGGVKVGDEFMVSRPEKDTGSISWFIYQSTLKQAMGTLWKDVGRLKVIHVDANTSTAEVVFTCDMVLRGDFLRPYTARNSPMIQPGAIDPFAPPSGKPTGMVVTAKNWQVMVGTFDVFYLNLGSAQGAKEGDLVRIFRHQGTRQEMLYKPNNTAYAVYGFGSTPVRYTWKDLPREILGEGVILRSSENSSTVLVTKELREVFLGDYVEIMGESSARATAACSTDKPSIMIGSNETVRVNARATAANYNTMTYTWTTNGGRVDGNGPEVTWNPANAAAGVYTVTARMDDGKGGTASCAADIRLESGPNRAPSLTCSANRSTVLVGERVRIIGQASDPDNDTLTYSWRAMSGEVVGSGSSVQFDTSGLAPGRYTVTGHVDDGRGGTRDCLVSLGVEASQPPATASKMNECSFGPGSARVDNVCKRILDDVAVRLQNAPRARVVLIGYTDPGQARSDQVARQSGDAAKKYLADKGIASTRIDVRTAAGQAGAGRQNRRLDVIWVPEGATY